MWEDPVCYRGTIVEMYHVHSLLIVCATFCWALAAPAPDQRAVGAQDKDVNPCYIPGNPKPGYVTIDIRNLAKSFV